MPLVIDRQMKAVDAIIASARLMKGMVQSSFFSNPCLCLARSRLLGADCWPLATTAWAIFI